jgi:SAM-dependent methyltransferase
VPDNNEILNWYQTLTPEPAQRNNWYGDVAQTYDRVRPKYAPAFLERVSEIAQLPHDGKILEIGCGPGTATISLAKMGFSVVALEPSFATCNLARQNLAEYPNIQIINSNFEEWQPGERKFDAILAATSWHWVAPASKYQKAASLLKDNGSLILLWNTGMKPTREIFEHLIDLFIRYIPTFANYKDSETELEEMRIFADEAIDSGLFSNLRAESQVNEVNYAIDDYLQLLTTYSPCIALTPDRRAELLDRLRARLAQICGTQMPLSYQSVFHILDRSLHLISLNDSNLSPMTTN